MNVLMNKDILILTYDASLIKSTETIYLENIVGK